MSDSNRRVLPDTIMYIGIVLLFFVLAILPFINVLMIWFLPLPFLLLALKKRPTQISVVVLLIGISLFLAPVPMFILWSAFVVGYVMGLLYKEPKTSAVEIVLGGGVGGVASFLLSLYLANTFFHMGSKFDEKWEATWKAQQINGFKIPFESLPPVEVLITLAFFGGIALTVLLNLWAARKWLVWKGFPGKYLPRFHNWNLPKSFFYIYVVAMITFVFQLETIEVNGIVVQSFIAVLHLLFLIQGLSVLSYLLHRKQWHKGWIMVPVLLSCIGIIGLVVQLVGVIDVGFGIKKRASYKKDV